MFRYIGFASFGILLSVLGLVGSAVGGGQQYLVLSGLLFLTYVGVISFLVKKSEQGLGQQYAYLLTFPMLFVVVMHVIFLVVSHIFSILIPDSEAFTVECNKTEVKYIKPPTKPVRSIAYDWDSEVVPSFITYTNGNGTRISDLRYSSQPNVYNKYFDFTEIKPTSSFETPRLGAGSKYLRFPKNEIYWGVAEMTADILVKYKTSPIEQLKKDGAIRYELTVSDRRNGDTLAYLRYVVDVKKQRACGLAGKGRVSDSQFIRKAIGL